MSLPPGVPPSDWRGFGRGLPLPAWRFYAQVPSTQDIAQEWARRGASEGCLVYAEHQTQGRGRGGRRWITPPGQALAFSLIVRPLPQEAAYLSRLPGWAALGVARALEGFGLQPRIKWPNDILLGGRKVAGVLVESTWAEGPVPAFVVVGIGLNVYRGSVPPEPLAFPATCLEEHWQHPIPRPRLLARLWHELFRWRYRLAQPLLLQAWEERLAYRGHPVLVRYRGESIRAVLLGLTQEGFLRVRTSAGEERVFTTVEQLRPLVPPSSRAQRLVQGPAHEPPAS